MKYPKESLEFRYLRYFRFRFKKRTQTVMKFSRYVVSQIMEAISNNPGIYLSSCTLSTVYKGECRTWCWDWSAHGSLSTFLAGIESDLANVSGPFSGTLIINLEASPRIATQQIVIPFNLENSSVEQCDSQCEKSCDKQCAKEEPVKEEVSSEQADATEEERFAKFKESMFHAFDGLEDVLIKRINKAHPTLPTYGELEDAILFSQSEDVDVALADILRRTADYWEEYDCSDSSELKSLRKEILEDFEDYGTEAFCLSEWAKQSFAEWFAFMLYSALKTTKPIESFHKFLTFKF